MPIHHQCDAMTTSISLVQTFQQHLAKNEFDEAFALVDADAVWHSDEIGAPWSGVHHGLDAIKEHFLAIRGTTREFTRTSHRWIADEDLVIELGSLSCFLNKTSQPFATEYVCLYTVRNNTIHSYRIFEDSLKLYRAYFATPK